MKYYDNPYWEHHLPVNPPGSYFREGFDVMLAEVDLRNWYGENGLEFRPRLRDNVSEVTRSIVEDEVAEAELELDCE